MVHATSDRQQFCQKLAKVVEEINFWEKKNRLVTEKNFFALKEKLLTQVLNLPINEKLIFYRLIDLFALKHKINLNKIFTSIINKNANKYIGFLGPLGVGKSTISQILIKDLKANFVVKEPHRKNPFWAKSQQNPDYMLRSQIYFLLSNIFSDIKAKASSGIAVSDTSTLTDILMWAKWYYEVGFLTSEEYSMYQEVVRLFKPIIPSPNLLVILLPDKIENLIEGIKRRQKDEPWRKGELNFGFKDLKIQIQRVDELCQKITDQWGVPVLKITVNPVAAYENPSLSYDYVYQIRRELNLLGELLEPQPQEAVKEILRKMAESRGRTVILIHSKSMFSGKTTVSCLLASELGKRKTLAFQPRAAVRYQSQEKAIVSRDGYRLKAKIIEDNDLETIIKYIRKKRLSPKQFPYIFIDEVMLFIAQASQPKKAIAVLDSLRKKGFHIIANGIDFTFRGEYFTFMKHLLKEVKKNKFWHEIETSTRCRYCDRRAKGTRRNKIGKDGKIIIADYHDTVFLPGDSTYEPVCQEEHFSCRRGPK
ncbi:MAG: deoxynucleoside kinase [Microgenomates group bacterium]|nr:deoxynucleoside kinase [Microgenomates group bacterium]